MTAEKLASWLECYAGRLDHEGYKSLPVEVREEAKKLLDGEWITEGGRRAVLTELHEAKQKITELENELAAAAGARDGALDRVKVLEANFSSQEGAWRQANNNLKNRIAELEFEVKATQDANKLWAAKQPCDRVKMVESQRAIDGERIAKLEALYATESERVRELQDELDDLNEESQRRGQALCRELEAKQPCDREEAALRASRAYMDTDASLRAENHGLPWLRVVDAVLSCYPGPCVQSGAVDREALVERLKSANFGHEYSPDWSDEAWLRVVDTAIASCCQSRPVEPIGAIIVTADDDVHVFAGLEAARTFFDEEEGGTLFHESAIIDHRKKPEAQHG